MAAVGHIQFFSPLGKLARKGLYILLKFFLYFLFFLMVDFLIPAFKKLMGLSSPKFLDW